MLAAAMNMATMMNKATIFQQTFRNSGEEKRQNKTTTRQDNARQFNTMESKAKLNYRENKQNVQVHTKFS